MVRAIALCLLLSGCSLFSTEVPEPIIIYKTRPIVCNVVKPLPIKALAVTIEVIKDEKGKWWVALNDKSYENIAINNKEVNRYIKDLQLYADTLNVCITQSQEQAQD